MATTDKYDRQLRLWGAAGQAALGATCVVLVRATAAGTETCKNLVLPGCGALLVLDDDCDCNDDDDDQQQQQYASNFFLTAPSTTKGSSSSSSSRAEMALECLCELNPDVQGSWTHCEDLLAFDFAAAFAAVTTKRSSSCSITRILVVASDLEPPLLAKVAETCWNGHIPLIAVHSYGLMGVVRLQTPPLPLLNPKPRDAVPDLRLVHPFPAVTALANSIDWSSLEVHQHAHVPYPLILLKMAHEWKATHDAGRLPATLAEKQEFVDRIRAASRNYDTELNFQEAVRNAYTAYTARKLDTEHLAAIRDATASNTNNVQCQQLHALLDALEQFLSTNQQQPPVQGSIPDMTASTDLYVQLQTVYREQAAKDIAAMKQLLSVGNSASVSVDDEMLTTFCQNVYAIDVLQTGRLVVVVDTDETTKVPDELCEDLSMATMEGDERPDQLPLLWYLGFIACQLFYTRFGRYPGTVVDDYTQDVAPLQACIVETVHKYKLSDNEVILNTLLKSDDYAAELTRYGNAEIHTVASVVGGVASQEAVKIITGQYVPFNNTYIYNGIASTGAVYKF